MHRVGRVDAKCMIIRVDVFTNGILNDFEIADHAILIEVIGFKDKFDGSAVTVREATFVRVF